MQKPRLPSAAQMMLNRAHRLQKLINLNAPDVVVFGEVKLIERAFELWCLERNLDPTAKKYGDACGPQTQQTA